MVQVLSFQTQFGSDVRVSTDFRDYKLLTDTAALFKDELAAASARAAAAARAAAGGALAATPVRPHAAARPSRMYELQRCVGAGSVAPRACASPPPLTPPPRASEKAFVLNPRLNVLGDMSGFVLERLGIGRSTLFAIAHECATDTLEMMIAAFARASEALDRLSAQEVD